MADRLLLHEGNRCRDRFVVFNRDDRLAHAGLDDCGHRIEPSRNRLPAQIRIGDDPDVPEIIIHQQRPDFPFLKQPPRFFDCGILVDAANLVRHVVGDSCPGQPSGTVGTLLGGSNGFELGDTAF